MIAFTLSDYQFAHWLKRKCEIIRDGSGAWLGSGHPNSKPLESAIDDELDRLRPLRNPNVSFELSPWINYPH